MSKPTGLFERNGHYYLRLIIPTHQRHLFNGRTRIVQSLNTSHRRQAVLSATLLRAEIFSKLLSQGQAAKVVRQTAVNSEPETQHRLRDVFNRWRDSKQRTKDSIQACERALCLFEDLTANKTIGALTRDDGDAFRSALSKLSVSSKTTKDRFTWVKSLLRFACDDLAWIGNNPWAGLKITSTPERTRRAWTENEIDILLSHAIYTKGELPTAWNAGGWASYWLPLLGLLTGARLSELAQLKTDDVCLQSKVICIRDRDPRQRLKTRASSRSIPIHSELLRLGFDNYVSRQREQCEEWLWSDLPKRDAKAGGFFSAWFSQYREQMGLAHTLDFHSFRHTVRTQLATKNMSEPLIDRLLGHMPAGSIGAKTYTHADSFLAELVAMVRYPAVSKLTPLSQEPINKAGMR